MLIVTGGIACGKSTLLEVARGMGYNCIDADEWFITFLKPHPMFKEMVEEYFGNRDINLKSVAFKHENWYSFCERVDALFTNWLNFREWQFDVLTDIVVIPDYFNRTLKLGEVKVLTIERSNNVLRAMERDTHRQVELTIEIHNRQMTSDERCKLADYVMINRGSKNDFEEGCKEWLELHLPEVSTRRT